MSDEQKPVIPESGGVRRQPAYYGDEGGPGESHVVLEVHYNNALELVNGTVPLDDEGESNA